MSIEPERLQIIKLHKKWADGLTLLWLLIILSLFGVIYFLFEKAGMSADERNGAFILLATIIVVVAVWQAMGLGIARLHMIFHRLNLEHPSAQK